MNTMLFLVEYNYGKWAITVNYHMSLHIPDIISDFGPPNTFWCFSYERVNGTLAGTTPNSNRNIEVEVTVAEKGHTAVPT